MLQYPIHSIINIEYQRIVYLDLITDQMAIILLPFVRKTVCIILVKLKP